MISRSTNKLPDNPYPERSHLLLEGFIDIVEADWELVGSTYYATKEVELTNLIQLGNRIKGYPARTLEAKAWFLDSEGSGGDVFDFMRPLPYTDFITGELRTWIQITNTYNTVDDVWTSFLLIEARLGYLRTVPLQYSYKIYNTIYEFSDI